MDDIEFYSRIPLVDQTHVGESVSSQAYMPDHLIRFLILLITISVTYILFIDTIVGAFNIATIHP